MKRAANLTVDATLLDEAKALKINLSQVLESSLRTELARRRAELWRAENKAALESYNAWVDENGLPLDQHRQF